MHHRNKTLLISSLVAAATLAGGSSMLANVVDLAGLSSGTYFDPQAFTGATVNGSASTGFFANFNTQPAGTGVFDPFLTINSHGNATTERGYNTDGHTALYLDQQRPEWNTTLKLSDLAVVTVAGVSGSFYAFELDADEPQNDPNNLISIDNIRIYTSSTDNTGTVDSNEAILDQLGTLRWAMNDPLMVAGAYNDANWVNLNANNHGNGQSDMIVYIPTSFFAGAGASDFVWFYNLNGVHEAADPGTGATAGFEEWRAVVGGHVSVPDGGSTMILLGSVLAGVGYFRSRKTLAKA